MNDQPTKRGRTVHISHEMLASEAHNSPGGQALDDALLRAYGQTPPVDPWYGRRATPEERAARAAEAQARRAAERRLVAELTAHRDPATVAVLALHALGNDVTRTCSGCDQGDYSQSDADWPCRTIITLATAHHITIPEHLT